MAEPTTREYKNLRNALAVIALLLCAVVGFGWVTYDSDQDDEATQKVREAYERCVTTNDSRATIKRTLTKLFDAIEVASPPERREGTRVFFEGPRKDLEEGLPQQDCVEP